MNVKGITEGMTATQVAQVIEDNFNETDRVKADKEVLDVEFDRIEKKIDSEINRSTNEDKSIKKAIDEEIVRSKNIETELKKSFNANRFGFNVSAFGLIGGTHTLRSAIKNVPQNYRILGQKITFFSDKGVWETWQNKSFTYDAYEKEENWTQEVGIVSCSGEYIVNNNPDYEDLTATSNGILKFADKTHDIDNFSGLGRVYLRKNILDGVNVLKQDMISISNTIYIIQYDYDLQGQEINIPENCILNFQGGSFKNGKLNLSKNVKINGDDGKLTTPIVLYGENISIKNVEIECNEVCVYGENPYNVSNLLIENCTLVSTGNNCVKIVADTLEGVIENIKFINTKMIYHRMGIELQNHGDDTNRFSGGQINKCFFKLLDKTSYNYGYAVSLSGVGEYISVTDCVFDTCYMGIELVGFNKTIITNNRMLNGVGPYWIAATNVRRMRGTIIANNNFENQELFITNSDDFQVTDNIFTSCNGITFTATNRGEFKNNHCVYKPNTTTAFMIDNASYSKVENNHFDISASTNFYCVMRAYGASAKYNVFKENFIAKPEGGNVFDQINEAVNNFCYDYYLISNGEHISSEFNNVKALISNGDNNTLNSIRKSISNSYVGLTNAVVGMLYGVNNNTISSPSFVIRKLTALNNNKIDIELNFMFRRSNEQYWAKVRLTDCTYSLKNPIITKEGSLTAEYSKTTDESYTYYTLKFSGNYEDAIVYGMYYCSSGHDVKWC